MCRIVLGIEPYSFSQSPSKTGRVLGVALMQLRSELAHRKVELRNHVKKNGYVNIRKEKNQTMKIIQVIRITFL